MWKTNFYPAYIRKQMPVDNLDELIDYWLQKCFKQACEVARNDRRSYQTDLIIDSITPGFGEYNLQELVSRVVQGLRQREFQVWVDVQKMGKLYFSWADAASNQPLNQQQQGEYQQQQQDAYQQQGGYQQQQRFYQPVVTQPQFQACQTNNLMSQCTPLKSKRQNLPFGQQQTQEIQQTQDILDMEQNETVEEEQDQDQEQQFYTQQQVALPQQQQQQQQQWKSYN